MERFCFYRFDPEQQIAAAGQLPAGYASRLWRPSGLSLLPGGVPPWPFGVWSAFHHGGIFRNRDYAVLLIRRGDELTHRSCVFPGYFRFPFMQRDDLQIGDTLTTPPHRGRGLAQFALRRIVEQFQSPGRRFWYLVDSDNLPSIRVAEQAGFRLVGEGVRTRVWGIRLLGRFVIQGESSSEPKEDRGWSAESPSWPSRPTAKNNYPE